MLEILDPTPVGVARTISEGLAEANAAHAITREDFAVVRRDEAGALIGGVTASVSFAVLFINNLWVADPHRRRGLGRALMQAAEQEGFRRGARTAAVDTLSTQAPGFYTQLGYAEFGRLTGEADGHPLARIWLRKAL
jgi:GNAT superfamily N-acetyltransferase